MKLTRLSPLLILCLLIANTSSAMAAFGTSPPWVKNDHMLPGTTFEQVINLSRSDTAESVRASVRISGDEKLQGWISIPDEENLIMREGQAILPMKVIVTVPEKAELKDYAGSIFVSLMPLKTDTSLRGGEVGITLGGNISVRISVVGTKVYNYRIKSIVAKAIEEGNPLTLNIEVENLGNVGVGDVNGQIDIYDSRQKEILRSFDFVSLEKTIPANETKITQMIFEDVILEAGDYWLFVKTFLNGKVIYENRLAQSIKKKTITVVNPEDTEIERPSLPKIPGEAEQEKVIVPEIVEVPVMELRPAAPAAGEIGGIFLIFGLAGMAFGLIAVIGVIVVLILILKNQQRTLQQMAGVSHNQAGSAMSPPAPVMPVFKTEENNSENNGNITIDAKRQE